jgi:hypothetical protein
VEDSRGRQPAGGQLGRVNDGYCQDLSFAGARFARPLPSARGSSSVSQWHEPATASILATGTPTRSTSVQRISASERRCLRFHRAAALDEADHSIRSLADGATRDVRLQV